ncbi:MAG: GGDEF domain-containing protein [Lachnospiraceae bacterium]|nr:GGDEF domain-containing protein [Lachnospiraceae bacterium]
MRKRIAVFICAISMENQQKIVEGILREAKAQNALCYIFTCHLNFRAKVESQEGSYNIMRLPDLHHFDGILFLKNTIQYIRAADELEKKIKESGVPAVSIDTEIEGMYNVMVDNYDAQYEVIRHMVDVHQAGRIFYVAGYQGNLDGEMRYQAFEDACRDYGILENDKKVFWGDFSIDSGRQAVEQVLAGGEALPDVFVCANDQMAIGAIEVLKEHGLRVPEDVAVTGFDADSICDAFSPMITTVRKNQREVGQTALRLLLKSDGQEYQTAWVHATMKSGCSCGCKTSRAHVTNHIRDLFVSQSITLRQSGDFIRNMSADCAATETLEEFYGVLREYIQTGDMKSCFLCMCDTDTVFYRENVLKNNLIDITNINTTYTSEMSVPVAYMDGDFRTYGSFPAGHVLPEELECEDEADFYVVAPVNYRDCCFGYTVSSNSYFALRTDLFFSWLNNVGIALENIRKQILMKSMMQRLNDMWIYDTMTKLYNRAGFYNLAEDYLEALKEKDVNAYIMFLDLDGLKRINDTLGHEMGDSYICAMGEILRRIKRVGDLVMRYGGDEFVMFGQCENEQEIVAIKDKIEQSMKKYSFGGQAFPLEASIGFSVCRAREMHDIHASIHEADTKMYELKKSRKTVRR